MARDPLAELTDRLLRGDVPLKALRTEAEGLAAAGDDVRAAAGLALLIQILLWLGEPDAARPHLARLAVLAPGALAGFALGAECARLDGDRRAAVAACEAGWDAATGAAEQAAGPGWGAGLLLGCRALAERVAERQNECLATGEARLERWGALDRLCFLAHAIDAAIDQGDWSGVRARTAALIAAFAPVPPLVAFLGRRASALAAAGEGQEGEALAAELRALAEHAERQGWRVWLPALDVALAVV